MDVSIANIEDMTETELKDLLKSGKAKPQSSRAKVLPKYRNPDNSEEVWSGRGRQPKWVQAALAEGQSLEDLAIPATGAAAAA